MRLYNRLVERRLLTGFKMIMFYTLVNVTKGAARPERYYPLTAETLVSVRTGCLMMPKNLDRLQMSLCWMVALIVISMVTTILRFCSCFPE